MLEQTSMIDQLAYMPMGQVRRIFKNNMAKQSVQNVANKQDKQTPKTRKPGFRRSTFKQIAEGVDIAIPLMLEGASTPKIMKETRRETGRALDSQILKRLREGRYSHREKVWTIDFENKCWTGPQSPPAVLRVPMAAAQDSDAIKTMWAKFRSDLLKLGVTSFNMREDGSLSITKTETIIIPS